MATGTRVRTTDEVHSLRRPASPPARPRLLRLTWGEWLAVGVAVVAAVLVLRARANMVPCAFLPLAVPAVLVACSRIERDRAGRAVRALWESLETYAAGGKTPRAAAVVFVVVPTALLDLSNGHVETVGDTSTVVPTAVSVLTEGNTDLDEFLRGGYWWAKVPAGQRQEGVTYFLRPRAGHVYPAHPSGMVPLALPVVALAKLAGAELSEPLVHLRLEKLTAAAVAAASLGVFLVLALHLVRPAPALVTTGLLAVASGVWTTVGQNLWQHGGIVLASLSLLLLEFRGPGRRSAVVQGLICGLMPAFRLTAVTFLVPFGAWILWRSPRRAVVVVVVAALAYAPWAAYYTSIYANPFGPSTTQMAGANWSASAASARLAAVVASPGRGLLTYQPWVVLAFLPLVPAVRRAAARRGVGAGPGGWAAVCVAAVVLEVLVVSAWHCWWGGYCWGSRLVVGVVPLCALLCARPVAALLATHRGRGLVAALALAGVLVQAPGVYTDAFRWNAVYAATPEQSLRSWSNAPFLAPFTLPPR